MTSPSGYQFWSRYTPEERTFAKRHFNQVLPLTCDRCDLDVSVEHEGCPHCRDLDDIGVTILKLEYREFSESCQRLGRAMLFAAAALGMCLLPFFLT